MVVVVVALVPFIVPPLCLLSPPLRNCARPTSQDFVVVAILLLRNGPVDTSPILLPPLLSAVDAVILADAVISLFLLLYLLIIIVNDK